MVGTLEPEVTHMARIGYARVSSTDQDLALQIERLKAAGCEMVRSEKVTGSTRQGRSELASIITFLRPGDELVVTRIDRLARSIGDLQIALWLTHIPTEVADDVSFRAHEGGHGRRHAKGQASRSACSRERSVSRADHREQAAGP